MISNEFFGFGRLSGRLIAMPTMITARAMHPRSLRTVQFFVIILRSIQRLVLKKIFGVAKIAGVY